MSFKEKPDMADLSEFSGDMLLFGGPYSNDHALAALFEIGRQTGIAPGCMICTGDLVAYCARPAEVVRRIRAAQTVVIAGNCERQIARGADACGCGFAEGSACDLASGAWFSYASQAVATHRDWFASLPRHAVFRHGGKRYGVIHGGTHEIARFLWPSSPEAAFIEEFNAFEALYGPVDRMIAGHCGIAFERRIGARLWINAGVIGMPPHDGRCQTRYAILSADGVRFHSLSYDAQAAAQAMDAVGLTQGYDAALLSGIWPSEDVLPSDLRIQVTASG